jgi:histidyl-tRNA synthetase
MIQAIKGAKDILPEDSYLWQRLEEKLRGLARAYHYEEIRVPTFEETELFVKGTGETTDIVGKEMYTFLDKGERSVTLKPEGTPSVIRAYLEHGQDGKAPLFKAYYLERMYRQEKPQAGRLRQFTQFGAEALGSLDPALDAEMLDLAWRVCETAGLKLIELRLSSIGCPVCRPTYKAMIKDKLLPKAGELCGDCKERLEKNPLRILDCKVEHCKELSKDIPSILDYLCAECKEHFAKVRGYLADFEIPYIIDTHLVRGLDYYTKTVFEIVSTNLGSQGALPAGGRYDGLVETLGGKPTPGVGFACGIERLLLAMEKEGVVWKDENRLGVFIATLGEEAKKAGFKLGQELRHKGYSCEMDFLSRSLKAQMREADRLKARFVLILGDEEIRKKVVVLRDMSTKEQKEVSVEAAIGILTEHSVQIAY